MNARSMTRFDPTGPLEPGVTLLEASAGTGKTHAITSVYLRLVAEVGLTVDQILVVTFTEAATAELRDRLRRRLREAAEAIEASLEGARGSDADPVIEYLLRAPESGRQESANRLRLALAMGDQAAVSTIHGFCRRMLQQNAFESRVEFGAEVLPDASELIEQVVRDLYATDICGARDALAKVIASEGFENAVALGYRVAEDPDLRLLPRPAGDLREPDESEYLRAFEELRGIWTRSGAGAPDLLQAAIEQGALNRGSYKLEKIEAAFSDLDSLVRTDARLVLDLPDRIQLLSSDHLRAKTNKGHSPPVHPLFDAVQRLLDARERLKEQRGHARIAWYHDFARRVRLEVRRRKQEGRLWSFHDLLVLLRDGLRDPQTGGTLAQAIRERYRAALIDEFQDTDGWQWEIFERVFAGGGHHLFLIGDPKQAIYSFRGADIYSYLRARETAGTRRTLACNWRSDRRLVDALNTLYRESPRPFATGEISYEPVTTPDQHARDRLTFQDRVPRAPLQIRFWPREQFGAGGKVVNKGDLWKAIPRLVAVDVAALLLQQPMVAEGEGSRPLRPRDVAILVRKHRQAQAIQAALRARGIPAVLHSDQSVFLSDAALDLARFLAAVVSDGEPRAVRTALTTPVFGMTVSDAALLAQENPEEWSRRLDGFREWRRVWETRGIAAMLRPILHEAAARILSVSGGERWLTDALHLMELLDVVQVERGLGPETLLSWFHQEREHPTLSSDSTQLRLESDADAVEVVTMHRAKGLEYPVVFCPYLWDGELLKSDETFRRFHDPDSREICASLDSKNEDHLEAAKDEAYEENQRLAYVALTRARHRLVVYWVAANQFETSALANLFHGHRVPGQPSNWREAVAGVVQTLDDGAILDDLRAVEAKSERAIAVDIVRGIPEEPRWRDDSDRGRSLACRSFDRAGFDRAWQWASFSRLVERGMRDEEADADLATPRDRAPLPVAASTALLPGFPSGRLAGQCLHRVFEVVDFQDPDPLPAVRAVLNEYGFDEALGGRVAEAFGAAMQVPLPAAGGAIRLRDVPRSDRLHELGFLMPVAGGLDRSGVSASLAGLAEAFERTGGEVSRRYAAALRGLEATDLRGFLQGQMDLAFRVRGTWFLVDYKSSNLGPELQDYAPPRLAEEMISSHYVLQYHLYTVALVQYLRSRIPGFDEERDFGGVFYLFLRGLNGRDASTGVFVDRPPAALMAALGSCLAGAGKGAR